VWRVGRSAETVERRDASDTRRAGESQENHRRQISGSIRAHHPVTARIPTIFIGCAGWSIASAQAGSFPGGGTHLERYARIFNAVEINSSFYRPHQPRTYARWAESVPAGFRFAVKMPKAISHTKRLRDCGAEVQAFLDQTSCLGAKLGILLLQLPPGLAFDPGVVLPFLDDLRKRHHGAIACEPRHASWFNANVDAALRERKITRVAADPTRVPRAAAPAGDRKAEYLRLHGSPRMYYDAYSDETLVRLARRLTRPGKRTRKRWCVFDNTAEGHAIDDALKLKALIADCPN
jgi:uncharacterized protein YecE (DUF72 family)